MRNNLVNFYDKYHRNTKAQKRFLPDNNFTHYHSFKVIKKYLQNKKNALDIGCGAGSNSFFIAKNGINVTGIDISKNSINECQQSAKQLGVIEKTKFIRGNFSSYKFSEKFDLVVCYEVLEHVENDRAALRKIYRLLNNQGQALISVPSPNSVFYKLGISKKFDKTVGHLRRYNDKSIIQVTEIEGFKVVEIYKIEGVLRDALYQIRLLSHLIKFIKFFASDLIIFIDSLLAKLFGESRIVLVLQK